jgi:hypothetical protein
MVSLSIDFGGTHVRVANIVNFQVTNLVDIPNVGPEEVFKKIKRYIDGYPIINRICISSFGPIVIDAYSQDFGLIYSSPKIGWNNINLYLFFSRYTSDVRINSDVNCSVLYCHYKCNLSNLVYLNLGTGVNAGVIINNRLVSDKSVLELGALVSSGFSMSYEKLLNGFEVQAQITNDLHSLVLKIDELIILLEYIYKPQAIFLGGGSFENNAGIVDDLLITQSEVKKIISAKFATSPTTLLGASLL